MEDNEIEWKIPEESEIEEESEEEEESEKESQETEPELENIIEPSTQGFRRSIEVTPFLETTEQPIENLEQDLQDVPATQTEEQEEQTTYTVNAPRYTAEDDETRYEIMQEARRPADPEMASGALIRREEDMLGMGRPQERTINFQRWQQTHVERGPEQQERYIRETKRIREEDKLPFQRKRKRLF